MFKKKSDMDKLVDWAIKDGIDSNYLDLLFDLRTHYSRLESFKDLYSSEKYWEENGETIVRLMEKIQDYYYNYDSNSIWATVGSSVVIELIRLGFPEEISYRIIPRS